MKKAEPQELTQEVMQIKSIVRDLKFHYYISAILMAAFGVAVNRGLIPHHNIFPEGKGIIAQTIFMILVLLCIPLLLKWFNNQTKKLKKLETLDGRLSGYRKYYKIRIYAFDVMAIVALTFAVLSEMKQAIMFFMMIFLFYFFFLPGFTPLIRDLDLNEDGSFYDPDKSYNVHDTIAPAEGEQTADDDDDDFIPKNPNRDSTRVSRPL